jgi:hypothetical protein
MRAEGISQDEMTSATQEAGDCVARPNVPRFAQTDHSLRLDRAREEAGAGGSPKREQLANKARSIYQMPQSVTQHTIDKASEPSVSDLLDSVAAVPLPHWLEEVLSGLPTNVNRRRAAEEISHYLFPVSHRSLEAWPLPTRRVNGQAIVPTRTLFALAFRKYSASPVVMGGRRKSTFAK